MSGSKKLSQNEIDKILSAKLCEGFDYESSEAWRFLKTHFGTKVNQADLKCLADLILMYLKPLHPNLYLPRESRRRKEPLVCWYQIFLPIIKPFILNHVVIERQSGDLIGQSDLRARIATKDEIITA